jgi:hypothetical protein
VLNATGSRNRRRAALLKPDAEQFHADAHLSSGLSDPASAIPPDGQCNGSAAPASHNNLSRSGAGSNGELIKPDLILAIK